MSLVLPQFVMRAVAASRWPSVGARLIVLLALLPCAATAQYASSVSVSGGGTYDTVNATVELNGLSFLSLCNPSDGSYGNLSVYIYFNGAIEYAGEAAETGDTYFASASGSANPGTYNIEGSYSGYSGTDNDGNSCTVETSSATGTAVVAKAPTSISVQGPTGGVQAGQALNVTVTLSDNSGSSIPATGNLTLYYGPAVLATTAVSPMIDSSGNQDTTLSLPTKGITPGNYSLTVTYSGDSNYISSSGAYTAVIEAAQQASTTTISATPNPIVAGDTITLNVSVTPTGNVTPTGTVSLLANGSSLRALTLKSGSASLSALANVPAGTYSIQALYGGDTYNSPSTSSAVTVTVDANTATTTTLTATPFTVAQGQTVALVVSVTPKVGNVAPTGTVEISVNGTPSAKLPLEGGTASLQVSTTGLAAGKYSVAAAYNGNSTNLTSTSTTQTVTVTPPVPATSVSVTASPNPVMQGNITTLSATVKSGSTPVTSGTVAFSEGNSALGTANPNSSGVAQLPIATSGLAAGTYTVQAAFSGSGSSIPAATGTVSLVVQ
jgi:hypothetical protein